MESNAFLFIEKVSRLAGRNKSIYCGMVRNKTRRNEIVREKVIQKNNYGQCVFQEIWRLLTIEILVSS